MESLQGSRTAHCGREPVQGRAGVPLARSRRDTGSTLDRFMESLDGSRTAHWDHEPAQGRAVRPGCPSPIPKGRRDANECQAKRRRLERPAARPRRETGEPDGGGHCQRGSLFRRCAVCRQVRPADFAKYFHDRAGRKFLIFSSLPTPQPRSTPGVARQWPQRPEKSRGGPPAKPRRTPLGASNLAPQHADIEHILPAISQPASATLPRLCPPSPSATASPSGLPPPCSPNWPATPTDCGARAKSTPASSSSPWSSPKGDCLGREVWPTRAAAQAATFDYVETFYNRERRHSALG
jgi:hypothetical protein